MEVNASLLSYVASSLLNNQSNFIMSKNLIIGIVVLIAVVLGAMGYMAYQQSMRARMVAELAKVEAVKQGHLNEQKVQLLKARADSLTFALKECQEQVRE